MTNQSNLTRVRIYSHVTQSRFLHIEDTLSIGKVRLFAGTYRKGQGMDACTNAFMDISDARIIFSALARGEQGFSYKEYKGTPPQTRHLDRASVSSDLDELSRVVDPLGAGSKPGRRNGKTAVSRVLSITVKGENVYIELKAGPGQITETGAIMPNGKPEVEVNIAFKLYEARRMAASVLAYIHAWDVMRMMVNQQMVSRPTSYLLVPATSATSDVQVNVPKLNGTVRPSVGAASSNGRLVSREPVTEAKSMIGKRPNDRPLKPAPPVKVEAAKPDTTSTKRPNRAKLAVVADTRPLQYGDGKMVDGTNLTEVQTFQQYTAEKKAVPKSKAVLLDYYRQRVQAPAGSAS
jgi:hypothetical protein